jgi:hypothetical protein
MWRSERHRFLFVRHGFSLLSACACEHDRRAWEVELLTGTNGFSPELFSNLILCPASDLGAVLIVEFKFLWYRSCNDIMKTL